jgi:hypothetical protein
MRRDPAEDFDHPTLPDNHPLRRHVLYRLDPDSYCAKLTSACGPTLPTWALQQVVGYLRYTGRDANVVTKAARDPQRSRSTLRSASCKDDSSGFRGMQRILGLSRRSVLPPRGVKHKLRPLLA